LGGDHQGGAAAVADAFLATGAAGASTDKLRLAANVAAFTRGKAFVSLLAAHDQISLTALGIPAFVLADAVAAVLAREAADTLVRGLVDAAFARFLTGERVRAEIEALAVVPRAPARTAIRHALALLTVEI
jgi:hypothetical protein